MAKSTRTIRLKEKDDELIEKFLSENPIFDFSTLARISILQFIKNPTLKIVGINANQVLNNKSPNKGGIHRG